MYARFGGRHWIRQMLLGAFLLPSMVCGVAFLINFIAIYYHASRAIPFTIMASFSGSFVFHIHFLHYCKYFMQKVGVEYESPKSVEDTLTKD